MSTREIARLQEEHLGSIAVVDVNDIGLSTWKKFLSLFCCPVEEDTYSSEGNSYISLLFIGLCIFLFLQGPQVADLMHLDPLNLFRGAGANFFTHALVHIDFMHLALNLIFIFPFIDNVEEDLGHWKMLKFILASAFFSAVFSLLFSSTTLPSLGMSGICFAIATYYCLRFPQHRFLVSVPFLGWIVFTKRLRLRAWILFLFYITLELVGIGDQRAGLSNIDHLAHLGGALVGFYFWRDQEHSQVIVITKDPKYRSGLR